MLSKALFRTLLCLSVLGMIACGGEKKKTKDNQQSDRSYLPKAAGEPNAILVVMDTTLWDGPIGDALKDIYGAYVPGLPQDEPYFKIRNVNPLKFSSILQRATNLIMITTLDAKGRMSRKMREYFTDESLKAIYSDTSRFLIRKRNVYANDQEILHLFGKDEAQVVKQLRANKEMLRSYFINAERERMANGLFKVREKGIENKMESDYKFRFSVPYGYDLSKSLPDFFWIRQLDAEFEKNVFVYFKPFDSMGPFEDMMSFREEITSTYMRDIQKPDIYMTSQEADYSSLIKEVSFNGKYAKECRGLWKLSDISGGGPFVSYLFVDESQKRIYYLEGYVYAPGEDKRVFMQEMELILKSFKSGKDLVP